MTPLGRYAAIILAAGFSTRMGQFKPLLRLGGETMTDRVISMNIKIRYISSLSIC